MAPSEIEGHGQVSAGKYMGRGELLAKREGAAAYARSLPPAPNRVSREMSEALIVNPYDGKEIAEALDAALRMPEQEQRERMHLVRQQVREQNVYRWARRMLLDAARIRQRRRILDLSEGGH